MNNLTFKFYSVLKNEDAMPYIGGNLLVAADGLGGSGSAVHQIDREKHQNLYSEIMLGAFGDIPQVSSELLQYINDLLVPMADGRDDTSALWASRIVIARCVYALTEGEFKGARLDDPKVRANLADFISRGLHTAVETFDLKKGEYDNQLLLPTTLAFIRYTEGENSVIAETLWAGDSRCYALLPSGLKLLSEDDEDDSGSITNLFFADNRKIQLNYYRHEIQKPCILMAVSDGIFDPFDPHDHLGVEHTLLSAIAESNTEQALADKLCHFYDSLHGDDATMAFVSFGFSDFTDMKTALKTRTDRILSIRQKQAEMYSALEVINLSEEEATHYVSSRTADRYDHIIPMLVDGIVSGAADIALTPEIRAIAEAVRHDCIASAEKAREHNRDQIMLRLNNYVKAHPEHVSQILIPYWDMKYKRNIIPDREYLNLFNNVTEYLATINNEKIKALEAEFAAKTEALHQKVYERIRFYRDQFDGLWQDKNTAYKLRFNIVKYLQIWQEIDFDLQYNWTPSNIGNLPHEDLSLAQEVRTNIDEYKKLKREIKIMRSNGDRLYRSFIMEWNIVYDYLKKCPDEIPEFLTEKALRGFGFSALDESLMAELSEKSRNRILFELKAQKPTVVSSIVRSLAENYNKASVIDGQYNATKLNLFRTYYRLRNSPNDEIKAFEKELLSLEAAYKSLIAYARF